MAVTLQVEEEHHTPLHIHPAQQSTVGRRTEMLVALLAVTKHQTKQLKPRRLIKAPAGRRQEQEVAGHSDIINWQAVLVLRPLTPL